jgi:thiol:disulfide interchange protein
MGKVVFGFLLLSSTLFSLEWMKDINNAFELAKKEQKSVMVLVEGENCRWCKKMKYRTLQDEAVEKRLEKFVLLKVMREDTSAMSLLPSVKGVPTIFFMSSKKTVVEEVIGFFDAEDFISYISDVEKKTK